MQVLKTEMIFPSASSILTPQFRMFYNILSILKTEVPGPSPNWIEYVSFLYLLGTTHEEMGKPFINNQNSIAPSGFQMSRS